MCYQREIKWRRTRFLTLNKQHFWRWIKKSLSCNVANYILIKKTNKKPASTKIRLAAQRCKFNDRVTTFSRENEKRREPEVKRRPPLYGADLAGTDARWRTWQAPRPASICRVARNDNFLKCTHTTTSGSPSPTPRAGPEPRCWFRQWVCMFLVFPRRVPRSSDSDSRFLKR